MEVKFDVIEQFLSESIYKFQWENYDKSRIIIHIPFHLQRLFVRWMVRESDIRCPLENFTFQGVRIEDNYLNTIVVSVKYALTKEGYQPLILNL